MWGKNILNSGFLKPSKGKIALTLILVAIGLLCNAYVPQLRDEGNLASYSYQIAPLHETFIFWAQATVFMALAVIGLPAYFFSSYLDWLNTGNFVAITVYIINLIWIYFLASCILACKTMEKRKA